MYKKSRRKTGMLYNVLVHVVEMLSMNSISKNHPGHEHGSDVSLTHSISTEEISANLSVNYLDV